jgi:hypothetical protein
MAYPNINTLDPLTGRLLLEDGSTINKADIAKSIYNQAAGANRALLVDAAGNPISSDHPLQVSGSLELTGSKAEIASAQDTQAATTVQTYTRAEGASQIELYVETGYVRVRTDGQPCTSMTGEPIAAGFGSAWQAPSISVYYIQESVITVVSR